MMLENEPIAALCLTIASPAHIRAWSSGEVTLPETINYLTEKPEPDGLFCERIFGPTADWMCACGKYRRVRTPGFVCEVCGVEITTSSVRRERMGHIELAAPVAHPWFARHAPSIIALLLGLSQRKLTAVLTNSCYLVLAIDEAKRERALMRRREGSENEAHDLCPASLFSDLAVGDILDETTFRQLSSRYGDVFRARSGRALGIAAPDYRAWWSGAEESHQTAARRGRISDIQRRSLLDDPLRHPRPAAGVTTPRTPGWRQIRLQRSECALRARHLPQQPGEAFSGAGG